MVNLSKLNNTSCSINQYRIVEWLDEDSKTITFLCCKIKDGQAYGGIFQATSHEQVFAWLRLVVGNYPGTTINEAA